MRAGLIVAGVFLLIIGFALTITIIGAIIGIPIGLLGFVMMLYGALSSGKKREMVYMPPAQAGAQQQVVFTQPQQYAPQPAMVSQSAQAGDTKFCQFCGSKMLRIASFCPSCGKQQP